MSQTQTQTKADAIAVTTHSTMLLDRIHALESELWRFEEIGSPGARATVAGACAALHKRVTDLLVRHGYHRTADDVGISDRLKSSSSSSSSSSAAPLPLRRVCAWCKPPRLINADGSPGELAGAHTPRDTHGMCNPCEQKFAEDIQTQTPEERKAA